MYRGEVCEDCGFPVSFFVRSYWTAPDDLWNAVVGIDENPRGEGVILCPPCFTDRAREHGRHVRWRAEIEGDAPDLDRRFWLADYGQAPVTPETEGEV